MQRVGVLISGRGSNLRALVEAAARPGYPAAIVRVISNRADAAGLEFAKAAGIPSVVIDHKAFGDRQSFEEALIADLAAADVDMVCNAGFMRILTSRFVDHWRDRHLNIHPSLLPAYRGLETHERVLNDGVRMTGCTVHFVRQDMDAGPIVAQAAVPVVPGDTPETLAERVLAAEHRLYPHALALVASGRARVVGERVLHDGDDACSAAIFSPPIVEVVGDDP